MSALEVDAVVKHYDVSGERVHAIDGVDLSVERAEMLALSGPSGSGKSTLLLLIAGLLSPDSGFIRFDTRDLATLSVQARAEYLRRDVGFIFQSARLMPKVKALDNAALKLMLGGLSMRQARARVIPWLQRLGLEDRLDHTPEQLSGGERQRVAIARALASEPKLILADEPTGNLDSARSIEIVELLRTLAREQGAAVLLVTHDVDAAQLAHRALLLRDGRLVGEEPTRESSLSAATSLGAD